MEVPTPAIVGKPATSGYTNDPVNVATGNFIEEETDMAFSGAVSACAVTRMYNSVMAVLVSTLYPVCSVLAGPRILRAACS